MYYLALQRFLFFFAKTLHTISPTIRIAISSNPSADFTIITPGVTINKIRDFANFASEKISEYVFHFYLFF